VENWEHLSSLVGPRNASGPVGPVKPDVQRLDKGWLSFSAWQAPFP
jgi:hypothetical protein